MSQTCSIIPPNHPGTEKRWILKKEFGLDGPLGRSKKQREAEKLKFLKISGGERNFKKIFTPRDATWMIRKNGEEERQKEGKMVEKEKSEMWVLSREKEVLPLRRGTDFAGEPNFAPKGNNNKQVEEITSVSFLSGIKFRGDLCTRHPEQEKSELRVRRKIWSITPPSLNLQWQFGEVPKWDCIKSTGSRDTEYHKTIRLFDFLSPPWTVWSYHEEKSDQGKSQNNKSGSGSDGNLIPDKNPWNQRTNICRSEKKNLLNPSVGFSNWGEPQPQKGPRKWARKERFSDRGRVHLGPGNPTATRGKGGILGQKVSKEIQTKVIQPSTGT